MRIAFLCSGLEPGKDGIGDYARRLAEACEAAGHETRLVALRDPQLGSSAPRPEDKVLRLRNVFENPGEAEVLKKWLADFAPDWASVQFTPFGFHPRGLGKKQAAFLRELMPATVRRHLMAHEIWLQPGKDGRLRHKILGWFQRANVDAWAKGGWQPAVIHTQARLHQMRLRSRGVNAEILPLFSTFTQPPQSMEAARGSIVEWAKVNNRPNPPADEHALWIGHFGAFHDYGWDWPSFARRLAKAASAQNKRACFLSLGRAASAQRAWEAAAKTVPEADFVVLGEMPMDKVPLTMMACDLAFTSTPADIVEKSSATAAWRALGVQVLIARTGAVDLASLPPWPDPGFLLFDGKSGTLPSLPLDRVSGPEFLRPDHTGRALLASFSSPTAFAS